MGHCSSSSSRASARLHNSSSSSLRLACSCRVLHQILAQGLASSSRLVSCRAHRGHSLALGLL
jgi:hypothetical protein